MSTGMIHQDDRRRPQRHIEEVGESRAWYMVTLNAPLSVKGYTSATVVVPKLTTDADIASTGHTFADEWKPSSKIITKVWNGFTPDGTLDEGSRCRIERYYGRWIVTQVEC